MTTRDESNDNVPATKGSNRRLFLLIGLLALALLALWYDYKVARPAVEQAYDRVAATNQEINTASQFRRMTNADVQSVLKRTPSETFPKGNFTVEAYRWNAGLPIEIRGLKADQSPGIGLKTFDYYAVYRKEGPDLAFITHFKFDLENDYFVDKPAIAVADGYVSTEEDAAIGMPGMGMAPPGGGEPGGGPGGEREFNPEAMFAERDVDGDGKLAGEEISDRLRGRLEAVDTDGDGAVSKEEFLSGMRQRGGRGGPGGPAGEGERQQRPPLDSSDDDAPASEAAPSEDAPAAQSKEPAAEPAPEKTTTEPAPEEAAETTGEAAKDASSSES